MFCRTESNFVTWRSLDIGATDKRNIMLCEYFSLLMMNGSGLEQTVVRSGLWPMSWIEVGNQIVKGIEDSPWNWMCLGGEDGISRSLGQKWIKPLLELARTEVYLKRVKLKNEQMMMWYEGQEKNQCQWINRPWKWTAELKNNGIHVCENKTIWQNISNWLHVKARERKSASWSGGGGKRIDRLYYSWFVLGKLERAFCIKIKRKKKKT